jgi:hypothetical protein
MKIEVAGRIRYPDVLVVCSPVDRKATVIKDPVVVFEVLCDSTAHIDHFEKLRGYTVAPSIRRYVLLGQDSIAATVYVRDGDRMVVETVARETSCSCRKSTWRFRSMTLTAGLSRTNQPRLWFQSHGDGIKRLWPHCRPCIGGVRSPGRAGG